MNVKGFSLVEVMVSSFIIAIALLGLASMQSIALKSVDTAQQLSLANSLLVDITERMQLNQVWLATPTHSLQHFKFKRSNVHTSQLC